MKNNINLDAIRGETNRAFHEEALDNFYNSINFNNYTKDESEHIKSHYYELKTNIAQNNNPNEIYDEEVKILKDYLNKLANKRIINSDIEEEAMALLTKTTSTHKNSTFHDSISALINEENKKEETIKSEPQENVNNDVAKNINSDEEIKELDKKIENKKKKEEAILLTQNVNNEIAKDDIVETKPIENKKETAIEEPKTTVIGKKAQKKANKEALKEQKRLLKEQKKNKAKTSSVKKKKENTQKES